MNKNDTDLIAIGVLTGTWFAYFAFNGALNVSIAVSVVAAGIFAFGKVRLS